jgi:hypothetical protein
MSDVQDHLYLLNEESKPKEINYFETVAEKQYPHLEKYPKLNKVNRFRIPLHGVLSVYFDGSWFVVAWDHRESLEREHLTHFDIFSILEDLLP